MQMIPIQSGHAQKTLVEKILGTGAPNKVQEPAWSPSHEGIQKHTH